MLICGEKLDLEVENNSAVNYKELIEKMLKCYHKISKIGSKNIFNFFF